VKYPGAELPEVEPGKMRFVVARDGNYLDRHTKICTTTTAIDGPLPGLDSHREKCVLHFGQIPLDMILHMLSFFVSAYQIYDGEAALVLLYNPDQRTFRWHCPPQTVEIYQYRGRWQAWDSVVFRNPLQLPDGFIRLGDAHSHVGAAEPSIVDRDDEAHSDGLHIVVGNLAGQPSYHIDFVVDGRRFRVPPEVILSGQPSPPYPPPPKPWLRCVRFVKRTSWYSGAINNDHDRLSNSNGGSTDLNSANGSNHTRQGQSTTEREDTSDIDPHQGDDSNKRRDDPPHGDWPDANHTTDTSP